MVSVVQNAIFVHVPKNAGSSISRSLGGVDYYWPQHVPWRCLQDEGLEGFGFLRNPWHRMVSLHYFLRRSPQRHLQRVDPQEIRRMGFKRWLLEGENWMSNEPVDGQIWIRQNRRYRDVSERNTYKNIDRLDHPVLGLPPQQKRPAMWWLDGLPSENIGKVENLPVDMKRFESKFAFRMRGALEKVNVTRGKPRDWRDEHDSETIDFIAQHHALDIEAGGYTFE